MIYLIQRFCGLWGNTKSCNSFGVLHSDLGIPTDEWVKLGLWVRLNTPGKSNGLVRLYLNDELYLSADDINIRGKDNRGFNYMWLGGNYSMLPSTGQMPSSGSRFIDEIRWYNTYPR